MVKAGALKRILGALLDSDALTLEDALAKAVLDKNAIDEEKKTPEQVNVPAELGYWMFIICLIIRHP
jgi:hypothetical protein